MNFVGRSVARLEDVRWSPATAASPRTSRLPANCTCAWCVPPMRMAHIRSRSTRPRAQNAPGVFAIWTRQSCRYSADRFSPYPHRRARPLSPADPRQGSRPLCRRARRRHFCRRSLYRRGCRRSGRASRSTALPELLAPTRRPALSTPGIRPKPPRAQKLWRRRHGIRAPLTPSSHWSLGSGATAASRWRPAAPSPSRRGARHPRAARRRQGAALEPRCAGPDARPRTVKHASARRPCRRRFWRARRNLSRGCADLRRRAPLGRPVKWIEDRREHLMAANHSRQQHFRVRAAVDTDGRLLAMDGEFFHDQGAYVRTHARPCPNLPPPC